MGFAKVAERLDRETFWMYVVPLIVGHVIVSLIVMVSRFSGLGGLDIVILLWLARVVGSRFRDIGWRPWIGIWFVIVTMMALPLVAVAVTAAVAPSRMQEVLDVTDFVVVPLNLLFIVVTGSVPGTVPLERLVIPFTDAHEADGKPVSDLAPPTPVPLAVGLRSTYVRPRRWEIAGGVVVVAILGTAAVSLLRKPTPAAPSVSSSAPPGASSYAPIRSAGDQPAPRAGLTKETNDFLRQFSAQGQGGAGTRPPSGNSIWPDPSKVLSQQKAAP